MLSLIVELLDDQLAYLDAATSFNKRLAAILNAELARQRAQNTPRLVTRDIEE